MARTLASRTKIPTARVAVNGRGTSTPTAPTTPFAPTFTNIGVTLLTQTSVRVTWTSDQVITTPTVNYGATASYGSTATGSSGSSCSVDITGLTAGSTYHYRVRGSNASAQETIGTDGTWTTQADPLPSDGATSGIESGITYTDYFIPSNIDDTGATDVSAAIQTFIASVPNGASATQHSRIRPNSPTSVYLISGDKTSQTGFHLKGTAGAKKRNITFWGEGHWNSYPITQTTNADSTQRSAVTTAYASFNKDSAWTSGATIVRRGSGTSGFNATLFLENCEDIQICGWTIDGENPSIGTTGAGGQLVTGLPYENVSALQIRAGCNSVRFHDNRIVRWRGFAILENNLGSGGVSPTGTKTYRNYIEGGEMGISPVDTAGHESYNNILAYTSLICYDLEGESTTNQISNVNIHHNIFDKWGIADWYQTCWWIAANSANTALTKHVDNITITDNYVKEGQRRGTLTNGASDKGGLAIRANKTNPKDSWVVSRNYTDWADQQASGSGRAYNYFATGSNFTYTDNVIPMTGTLEGSVAVEDYLFNWRRDSDNVVDRPTGTVTISGNVT